MAFKSMRLDEITKKVGIDSEEQFPRTEPGAFPSKPA